MFSAPELSGADPDADRTLVTAGQSVQIVCVVRNDGAFARVRVRARLPGSARVAESAAVRLEVGQAASVALAIEVPSSLAIDAELTVALEATSEDAASARAEAAVHLAGARPGLCQGGQLSREQYERKIADLARKRDAGLITQADYLQYEAELTDCLQ